MAELKPRRESTEVVGAYKAVLKRVLDARPSGTRHRLAIALGKNRSFISQIANPVYAVPIPVQHLETIFEICHFTAADRREFVAAYAQAHPRRLDVVRKPAGTRKVTLTVPDQMVAAVEAVDTGNGCLFIVKNYEGDVMNFQMAADLAGKDVATVVTDDDVAVERSTWSTGRRGVAGTLIVEKIVGAAAEKGASLAELKALGEQVNGRTRSMGVALTSCTVPAAGKPTFTLGEDEMELGVGIHGEPGRRRVKLASADAIADEMVGAIANDLAPRSGAEALLLVNGFGGTPAMELYLMVNSALRVLRGKGVRVSRFLTGNYVTSLEMAGCSVTVSLLDDALRELWDAPVHTAALRWS